MGGESRGGTAVVIGLLGKLVENGGYALSGFIAVISGQIEAHVIDKNRSSLWLSYE